MNNQDNWQHRSKGMVCGTCMFSVPKLKTNPDPSEPSAAPTNQLGRCRRHAPTMAGFPAIFESDWCGDHKLDENKI